MDEALPSLNAIVNGDSGAEVASPFAPPAPQAPQPQAHPEGPVLSTLVTAATTDSQSRRNVLRDIAQQWMTGADSAATGAVTSSESTIPVIPSLSPRGGDNYVAGEPVPNNQIIGGSSSNPSGTVAVGASNVAAGGGGGGGGGAPA